MRAGGGEWEAKLEHISVKFLELQGQRTINLQALEEEERVWYTVQSPLATLKAGRW